MGAAGADQTGPEDLRKYFPEGHETDPRVRLVSGSDGADIVFMTGREVVKSDPDGSYHSVGNVVRSMLKVQHREGIVMWTREESDTSLPKASAFWGRKESKAVAEFMELLESGRGMVVTVKDTDVLVDTKRNLKNLGYQLLVARSGMQLGESGTISHVLTARATPGDSFSSHHINVFATERLPVAGNAGALNVTYDRGTASHMEHKVVDGYTKAARHLLAGGNVENLDALPGGVIRFETYRDFARTAQQRVAA
jgi:hypothetical protein